MNARIISAGVLVLAIAATASASFATPAGRKTLSGPAKIVLPAKAVTPKVRLSKVAKPARALTAKRQIKKVAKPVVKKKIRSATKTPKR